MVAYKIFEILEIFVIISQLRFCRGSSVAELAPEERGVVSSILTRGTAITKIRRWRIFVVLDELSSAPSPEQSGIPVRFRF